MNRILPVAFTALLFVAVDGANAQTKKLTFEQSWGQAPSLTKPISSFRGWADESNYIESSGSQLFQVNVKTGEKKGYTYPTKSSTEVFVKDKDIYIQYPGSQAKQLTQSPEIDEQNPTLSPDGKYVAFTRKSDLYSLDVNTGKEIRYTTDGTDVIYNGWSSWVYYEEILGRPTNYKAFWWSPDSKQLAFKRFDDTNVPMFPIYVSKGQHGYLEETRYPKAGDPNPEVKVGFVKVEGSPV